MRRRLPDLLVAVAPLAVAMVLLARLGAAWAGRFAYPFDLEWMEAGMLAHAWRVDQGLPLYVRPNIDFMPFIYPPGYPWVVAAFSQGFGLSFQVGRAVSIAAILAAAGAMTFGLRRAGGSWGVALGAAVAFLGTWPQAGAFYDIVRPDSLAVCLLAWAVVLGLEERRWAPVAAGLLLAGAFLAKQNTAIAGLPMLLGLSLRGWRPALAFVLASAGPALAACAVLQWQSGGEFLVWLVEVPRSQVLVWSRAWLETPREWGTALPVAWATAGLAVCWDATARQRLFPPWLAAGLPVWAGMGCAWWFTYEPPAPDARVYNSPASLAYWALAAIPVALTIRVLGAVAARQLPSWRSVYAVGILLVLATAALVMRVHDGGFINVHTPLFWSLSAFFGAVLVRFETAWAERRARAVTGVVVAVQLLWSMAILQPARLIPSQADRDAGWRIVEQVRGIDGPVLSPFSAWIPFYAGQPPSLHAQGVWDANYAGGPYQDELTVIETALREHHWALIIGGQYNFLGDLTRHYEVAEELIPLDDPRLTPPTGMGARPWRTLVPRP